MQRQRSINRPAATYPDVAPAPAFPDLLSYQQSSAADSSVTYLYRPSQAGREKVPVAAGSSASVSSARRYDAVSYLQVDWDAFEAPVADAGRSTGGMRGLSNVYCRVLDRVERKVGASIAGDVLLLIHASRNGLTLEELAAISGYATDRIQELMAGLQNHTMAKEGRMTLLNEYIGRAIESRYAGADGEKMAEARERIVEYLENLAFSTRVVEELPWQLLELGALDRLGRCVTASPVAAALCDAGRRGDLCLYWNALEEHVDLRMSYSSAGGENGQHSEGVLSLLARYCAVTTPGRSSVGRGRAEIRITRPTGMEGSYAGGMLVI